jgi:hypothetical protein
MVLGKGMHDCSDEESEGKAAARASKQRNPNGKSSDRRD